MFDYDLYIKTITERINEIDDIFSRLEDGLGGLVPYLPEEEALASEWRQLSNQLELEGLYVLEGWVHSIKDPEYSVKINQKERA
jgi:hypothetical protein